MALSPDEIVVVANRNAAKSVSLAKYYIKKRKIPEKNLVLLWTTDKESCSRQAYDKKIVPPIRRHIEEEHRPHTIRCLVTVYGVPLKIGGTQPSESETAALNQLSEKKAELKLRLESGESIEETEKKLLRGQIEQINNDIRKLKFNQNTGASLDSELSLVLKTDNDIGGWTPNPYFVGFQKQKTGIEKKDVLMVSRLDGPSPEIVRRIIDDSLSAEKNGLSGTAYIDARWPDPGNKSVSGYALYDKSLHEAAGIIEESGTMPVTLEKTSELFAPGQCKTAALYCGWYRLARYVDAFEWQPGAVGYHIASSECSTLRNKNSQVWCKRMLEEGVAATIGPVGEPYVQSFPLPAIFFKYLTEGSLSLAECYILSVPYLSWKQVLVGDPLYRPFKRKQGP